MILQDNGSDGAPEAGAERRTAEPLRHAEPLAQSVMQSDIPKAGRHMPALLFGGLGALKERRHTYRLVSAPLRQPGFLASDCGLQFGRRTCAGNSCACACQRGHRVYYGVQ